MYKYPICDNELSSRNESTFDMCSQFSCLSCNNYSVLVNRSNRKIYYEAADISVNSIKYNITIDYNQKLSTINLENNIKMIKLSLMSIFQLIKVIKLKAFL